MKKIDLSGTWSFCMDPEKCGINKNYSKGIYKDSIILPGTVSEAKKGVPSKKGNTGYLTDPYLFEGHTWYSRMAELPAEDEKEYFLVLERTRISHVWINDEYAGSNNCLCSSHRYRITPYIKEENRITIMIDNSSYPVKGGHMTSADTQTNWNGITGEISIEVWDKGYLSGVKIHTNASNQYIEVKAVLHGTDQCMLTASVSDETVSFPEINYQLHLGGNSFLYPVNELAKCWSEHTPNLYCLHLKVWHNSTGKPDEYHFSFGIRDFKAEGKYFYINGSRVFLRGKHDGMIFPLTGYAPTDLNSWLAVLTAAKEYGINHYRFHTCCPPKAAFTAADMVGIYMEPELPFWGTVTEKGDKNHDEKAQEYLINEGFRILDEFGNHPSFVMMSLGNELWGSKARLNQILGWYKKYDARHLYTQGSNNFQFMPCLLENDDFFCGVRFSKNRLIRGSYAMCDAPQGHIQTRMPDTLYHYDALIRPEDLSGENAEGGDVTIQYGTGTKKVKADAVQEIIPEIPVVSHEIGQYAMYPDFTEIKKYTGVLKARNLEIFQKRLEQKGMLSLADGFFKASGRFAAECYKAEIETALRSNELAGFQLLDLQDFTGQGTALVGILDAFMENKGLISSKKWRQFCSDVVILAELPGFTFHSGQKLTMGIRLAVFLEQAIINPSVELIISDEKKVLFSEKRSNQGEYSGGIFRLNDFELELAKVSKPVKLQVMIKITQMDIENFYDIWVYPEEKQETAGYDIVITESLQNACDALKQGKKVLLYPDNLDDNNSIYGTYCTDFWCYPMFRSISESMGKPLPVGTMGLMIDDKHPVFHYFPTEYYTTPQWYDIITHSRALILDGHNIDPIIYSIDNFERNHRLGNLFELSIGEGRLLVCTSDLRRLKESGPAKWLEKSILMYMSSEAFEPKNRVEPDELYDIFGCII